MYGHILTTPVIAAEFGEPLPEWVLIESVKDRYRQRILEMQVDQCEASALALALETYDSTVIIDDYRARRAAQQLQINYTGTIGVIIKAKLTGIVPSIQPLLDKIKQTNFWITNEVEAQALREAGE